MKTYNDCAQQHGITTHAGIRYILLQDAYASGDSLWPDAHYEAACVPADAVAGCMDAPADGFGPDGGADYIVKTMVWQTLPDYNPDDYDEGDACDWDRPVLVR